MVRTAHTPLLVAGISCIALVLGACGGGSDSNAADVTCQDWKDKTSARETLRDEIVPKFQEVLNQVVEGSGLDGPSTEEVEGYVDDSVVEACEGEAADFRPYQRIVDEDLKNTVANLDDNTETVTTEAAPREDTIASPDYIEQCEIELQGSMPARVTTLEIEEICGCTQELLVDEGLGNESIDGRALEREGERVGRDCALKSLER